MFGRGNDTWGREWKWDSLLPASGLDGLKAEGKWRRSYDAVEAEGNAGMIIYRERVAAFEFAVQVTVISGGNAQVQFRFTEDWKRYYMVDFLMGWKALAISRKDPDRLRKLSVVNLDLRLNTEYQLEFCARDASLTTYIDGKLVNQVTDFELDRGPIVLNVYESKVRYRDPKIRVLD